MPLVIQEAYQISSDSSNCMKSGNPHSGINLAEISHTLDTTDPSPSKAQGGIAIVQAVYENQRSELRLSDKMNSITTPGGKAGQGCPVVLIDNQGGALPHVFKLRSGCDGGGKGYLGSDDKTFTLATNNDQYMMNQSRVRKLTPKECERLQGFPDDYTKIPYRGKSAEDCPDSPRYKAIGNSWAVPCVNWIGKRIQKELEKNEG